MAISTSGSVQQYNSMFIGKTYIMRAINASDNVMIT